MASKKKSTFVKPNAREITTAVALIDDKSQFMEFLRKCSDVSAEVSAQNSLFPPIATPGRHDWLTSFPTPPESFQSWERKIRNHVNSRMKTIYILPLGEFTRDKSSGSELGVRFLGDLEAYTSSFFTGMVVKMMKEVPVAELKCKSRQHMVDDKVVREQLMVSGIFAYMKSVKPRDAYCVVAVTMMDLYPNDEWNFVFGQASLQQGIGVFSFARYHPNFFERDKSVAIDTLHQLTPDDYQMLRWRAIKVLTHEIGHMFGLRHCVYFTCLLNGSNHAEESDRKLTFLCPVCLRKIQHAIKFDFLARYEGLVKFFQERLISAHNKNDKFLLCKEWLDRAISLAVQL
ncbi:archaemetzincin-2-like [Dysidea avara]|uniref:archaemetzincin-2-like n=1 Tax=Dysidea avara TaxID=196820 RepID=UPI003322661D